MNDEADVEVDAYANVVALCRALPNNDNEADDNDYTIDNCDANIGGILA